MPELISVPAGTQVDTKPKPKPEPDIPDPIEYTNLTTIIAFSHEDGLPKLAAEVIRDWFSDKTFTVNDVIANELIRSHPTMRGKDTKARRVYLGQTLSNFVHQKGIYRVGASRRNGETRYRIVVDKPAVQMEGEYVKGTTLRSDELAGAAKPVDIASVPIPDAGRVLMDVAKTDAVVGINFDPELVAMQKVSDALRNLSDQQRRRVVRWAWARFVTDPSSSISGGS